jgi:translation initiation factor 2B subunit (eIF-2B alpha/beta/delta family)
MHTLKLMASLTLNLPETLARNIKRKARELSKLTKISVSASAIVRRVLEDHLEEDHAHVALVAERRGTYAVENPGAAPGGRRRRDTHS